MASNRRFEFTTSSLTKRALPPAPDSAASDLIYWDTHRDAPPGFGVRVGKGRPGKEQPVCTFVVQRDMPNGKTKRVSLGRWLDEVTLEEARERAREVRSQLKGGIDPTAAERARRAEGATLRDAFERHLRGMESLASRGRRQPRSISDMRGHTTADRGGRAVVHVKDAEEDSLHGFGYTPHRARDTYATACEEAGISVMATTLLLNHRDQTITEGYQRGVSMVFLREAAERVAAFLLEKARVAEAA